MCTLGRVRIDGFVVPDVGLSDDLSRIYFGQLVSGIVIQSFFSLFLD